ncbi:MAG: hypothetical protein M5U26_15310 [Planctomycetota bacterium]|nr:hypothetical protein [Planctomycetota bacterium]
MLSLLVLSLLWIAAAVFQHALWPAVGPPGWQPDLALALGLASMAFLPPSASLGFVFALGVQADVLAGPRLGAYTLCYLAAAALLLSMRRSLSRSGPWGGWTAAVLGTFAAHALYAVLGPLLGESFFVGEGLQRALGKGLAALLLGAVAAFALGEVFAWTGMLSPEAQARRAPDGFGRFRPRPGRS